jgi:hypothetical protein
VVRRQPIRSGDWGEVLAAAIGLVGVVLGAVIAAGIPFLLERRRERQTVRAAVRLVALDLGAAIMGVQESLEQGEWWSFYEGRGGLVYEAWQETKGLLAATMEPTDWWMLVAAEVTVRDLNSRAEEAGLLVEAGVRSTAALTDSDRDDLTEALRELQEVEAGIRSRLDPQAGLSDESGVG